MQKRIYPIIISLTVFLSAALNFALQPLVGKLMLPQVGGTPAAWLVTLAFFQCALLGGYALAYLLSRLTVRLQGWVFAGLMVCVTLALPPTVTLSGFGEGFSLPHIMLALSIGVAMPFTILAACNTTLQRLYAHSDQPDRHDPHFLYAASNLGSFIGLISYPLLFEVVLTIDSQRYVWGLAYIVVALLVIALTAFRPTHDVPPQVQSTRTQPSWWLIPLLSCAGLVSFSGYVTTDIAPIPFLWSLILGLYLLSFVLAFSPRCLHVNTMVVRLGVFPPALAFAGLFLLPAYSYLNLILQIALYFLIMWSLHVALAMRRPTALSSPLYYLCITAGGALGGSLIAFATPYLIPVPVEYIVVIIACIGVTAHFSRMRLLAGIFTPVALALLCMKVGMALQHNIDTQRNFFGSKHVAESSEEKHTYRILLHGTTIHGAVDVNDPRKPLSYYAAAGPLGDAIKTLRPASIGVLGMGIGGICSTAPDVKIKYFEIDPQIVEIAKTHFDFDARCKKPEVVLGDARLELSKLPPQKFDMLVVDTFSSDAIPFHLIAVEAAQLYKTHLTKNGVIAINVSNRYLQLLPVIASIAEHTGLQWRYYSLGSGDKTKPHFERGISDWMILAPQDSVLTKLNATRWTQPTIPKLRPWRDDYSNLLAAILPDFVASMSR